MDASNGLQDSRDCNNTTKPSRQRPGSACTACRARKIRCDGLQPTCGTCAAAGIMCSQPDTPVARRGPKKGHMRALQQRVQNLELELNTMRSSGGERTPSTVDQHTSNGGQRPDFLSRSVSASGSSGGENIGDLAAWSASWSGVTGMVSPAESSSIDPFESFRLPNGEPVLPENVDVQDWLFPSSPEQQTTSQPLHTTLDDMYLERAHPVLLLHHRRLFASWARSTAKTEAQQTLQQAMWTLASALSARLAHTSPALYSQARASLATWQSSGTCGSPHNDPAWIQAQLLIAVYEALRMDIQQAGMTAAYCLRLMQMQQWHRIDAADYSATSNESPVVVEEKRRAFWLAFSLDRFISRSCKLPMTLDEDAVATCLPCSEQDFQQLDMVFTSQMPYISEALKCPDLAQFSPLAKMAVQAVIAGRTVSQAQMYQDDMLGDRSQRRRSLRNVIFACADSAAQNIEPRHEPMENFNLMLVQMNVLSLWLSANDQERSGLQTLAGAAAHEILSHSRMLVEWSQLELHPFTPLPLHVCAEFLRNRSGVDADASANLTEVLVLLQHLGNINRLAQSFVLNWTISDAPTVSLN